MIFIRFQAHLIRFDHQIAPQICPSGFPAVAGLESFLILLRKKRERTGNNKIRILHTKWTNLRNGKKVAKKWQKHPKKGPKSRKISQNCQKFHNFRAKTRKKGENSELALFQTFGSRIKKVSKCDISAPGRPTDLRHHSKRSEFYSPSF